MWWRYAGRYRSRRCRKGSEAKGGRMQKTSKAAWGRSVSIQMATDGVNGGLRSSLTAGEARRGVDVVGAAAGCSVKCRSGLQAAAQSTAPHSVRHQKSTKGRQRAGGPGGQGASRTLETYLLVMLGGESSGGCGSGERESEKEE